MAAYLREYDAVLDVATFERLFWERVNSPQSGVRFPLAIDRYFLQPRNDGEQRVKAAIDAYRAIKIPEWEQEIFKQRKRHADAQRALSTKHTKKAESDLRVSSRKVEQLKGWLNGVKSMEDKPGDVLVHPMNYAPVLVQTERGRMLTAMRYHCRLAGKPASIDRQLPTLYNARKTSLEDWWASVFGSKHAVFVITGFRENVKRHDMEHRNLAPGEEAENIVLQFRPREGHDMLVPCVWDHWQQGQESLNSFALITDEPPEEVAAAGHDRCPINLTRFAAEAWLAPHSATRSALFDLLEQRQRPYYEKVLAAA
ncbi:MAG: SOS response-associated peptidase family protein [Pseudomonadota bacterium]